ncbi:hypothetical protein [Pseudomonas fluorescens]|uniref:hypothetical protein n=1 Tax=Pseudomonas fluorescens TaxID=294 RepID=UPI003D1EA06E
MIDLGVIEAEMASGKNIAHCDIAELIERLRTAEADTSRLNWAIGQIPNSITGWKYAIWLDNSPEEVRSAIDFAIAHEERMRVAG